MMWSKLEEVFEKIGLPYDRQGSYSDESEYPPSFFTFWNPTTSNDAFYDNVSNKAIWHWNVYYYTSDPATLYSHLSSPVSLMTRFFPPGAFARFLLPFVFFKSQARNHLLRGQPMKVVHLHLYLH